MTRPSLPVHEALRTLGFFAVVAAIYVSCLALTARVRYGDWPLLAYLTHHQLEPGGRYQSLRRFREAAASEPVDVVFFGSSHAYRGFDPRLFVAEGLTAFNLGSTNQTPLNSLYLARRYLPRLAPKLVIFEVYYATLAGDGFESARDLAVNTPWSWGMLRMAFATRHLGAISFGVAKGLGLIGDSSEAQQRAPEMGRYVERGYCETTRTRPVLPPAEPFTVELREEQLDALVEASHYAAGRGARVVWVTHPFPKDHRAAVTNFDAIHAQIAARAQKAGLPYLRFEDLELDASADFADFHHLNAAGVARFNAALIARLRDGGQLP